MLVNKNLELVKRLEQHAGFVLNRLESDGNIYTGTVDINWVAHVKFELCLTLARLRLAISNDYKNISGSAVMQNMEAFVADEWEGA